MDKFISIREYFLDQNKDMYKKRTRTNFIIQLLSILSTTIIIFILFWDAFRGVILIGSVVAYINSITNVKDSFKKIFALAHELHQDSLHAKDILEVLKLPVQNEDKSKKILKHFHTIRFENVSFKYQNTSKYALYNFNFSFKKGKNYIIAGKNGSGKSTLTKLILGFYLNYDGRILVDEQDLKEFEIKSYRSCLSAVFQDFTMHQLSLNETVGLGRLEKMDDFEKIKIALELANVDFVDNLPDKYNQQLGTWFESSHQLSGGEWQKLSIARAFFRDNASLVVLDEPSSALDPLSEQAVINSFRKLSKNKIGLFITHRLKNIKFNGDIIFLENGKIIEYGTHEDLLAQGEEYAKMYHAESVPPK